MNIIEKNYKKTIYKLIDTCKVIKIPREHFDIIIYKLHNGQFAYPINFSQYRYEIRNSIKNVIDESIVNKLIIYIDGELVYSEELFLLASELQQLINNNDGARLGEQCNIKNGYVLDSITSIKLDIYWLDAKNLLNWIDDIKGYMEDENK